MSQRGGREPPAGAQLLSGLAEALREALLNVEDAFEPIAVMATMQTTMIKASITAYSTAVGPSSRFRNATALRANLANMAHPGTFE